MIGGEAEGLDNLEARVSCLLRAPILDGREDDIDVSIARGGEGGGWDSDESLARPMPGVRC